MAPQAYSLNIELIDDVAKEFVKNKPSLQIKISDCNNDLQKKIEIYNNKAKGVLNCFIKSSGLVSHNIQCKDKAIYEACNNCWNYIVENTKLPDLSQSSYSVKNVPFDDYEALMDILQDYEDIDIVEDHNASNASVRHACTIHGKYNAKLHITFYNNGTLFVQGAYTPFFIEFFTEILSVIPSFPIEKVEEIVKMAPRANNVIDCDLKNHFDDLTHISGGVIEKFIRTSITLINSGIVLDDYGAYTFSILKALDGIIRSRILEDAPSFDNYGNYFSPKRNGDWKFKDNVAIFDNNLPLKRALENGYECLQKHRNTSFHVDDQIETSRLIDFESAINIAKDCLVIINRICKHW